MSLIISANGGLGNRLRPLLSAISITKHLKHYVIKVLWCKNITCDTYYNTLFTNENISIIEIDEVCALKPHIGFIDYSKLKSYQDILKKDGNNSGVFNVKDKQAIDNLLCNNKNPEAIKILKANPAKINWYYLSSNSSAIELLKENPEKIVWDVLTLNKNSNPRLLEIIEDYPDKIISYGFISATPYSYIIRFLKANPEKINWPLLSLNSNPEAIKLLKANPTKINWSNLSFNINPEVIEILKDNSHKINWSNFSSNPNIFYKEMDIEKIKHAIEIILM